MKALHLLSNTNKDSLNFKTKELAAQTTIILGYIQSLNSQPNVDFSRAYSSKDENLNLKIKNCETLVNNALTNAKLKTENLQNDLTKKIIGNMVEIENFCSLHQVIYTKADEKPTHESWLNYLKTLIKETDRSLEKCKNSLNLINHYRNVFDQDTEKLNQAADAMNDVLGSNSEAIQSLKRDLKAAQSEVSTQIANTVIGAVQIVGGLAIIVVGSVVTFATAGLSMSLIFGGIAFVVAGIGLTTSGAIMLKAASHRKNVIEADISEISNEQKMITAFQTGFLTLIDSCESATLAIREMQEQWNNLRSDLQSLYENLKSGITSTDEVQEFFLTQANDKLNLVKADVLEIKTALTMPQIHFSKANETIDETLVYLTKVA